MDVETMLFMRCITQGKVHSWVYSLSSFTRQPRLVLWYCENPELFRVVLFLLVLAIIFVSVILLKKSFKK